MIRSTRAALALLLLTACTGAFAASEGTATAHYRGDLTMACGTKVVALDLNFAGDGAVAGTAIVGGTTMPVTGHMASVDGKGECTLEMSPGLLVGGSATLQTSFTFIGVKIANTGKKDAPRRLRGNEKKGPLSIDVIGG